MIAMPISLISFENCKMNSNYRSPDVYPDAHWAFFFENFENVMCMLIHTAPANAHQPFCLLPTNLFGNSRFFQFQSHHRLERGPAGGGASAIAAPGGDGSASIAQMYICALAGDNPWPQCRLRAETLRPKP